MSLGLTLPPIADWMMLALTSHYTATNAKHHRYAATSLRTVSGAGGWRGERLGRGGSGRPGSGRPGSGMGLGWGRVRSAGVAWGSAGEGSGRRGHGRLGLCGSAWPRSLGGGVGRLVEDGPLGPGRRRVGAGALGHLSRQGRSGRQGRSDRLDLVGRQDRLGRGPAPGRREPRDGHGRRIARRATEADRTADGSRARA
jgi:hypothetical protein